MQTYNIHIDTFDYISAQYKVKTKDPDKKPVLLTQSQLDALLGREESSEDVFEVMAESNHKPYNLLEKKKTGDTKW